MGKSKGRNKSDKKPTVTSSPLVFEIEENAHQLLQEHLDLFKPHVKDADTKTRQVSAKRITHSLVEIDLHGLTVEQAEREVSETIERCSLAFEKRTYKIITGKGRHSRSGRGVLIREVYLFVVHRYGPRIESIEESPDGVRLDGVAFRGHFHVTLKGS